MIKIKAISFFSKKIRDLAFNMVLQARYNSLYALVTPSQTDQRQRKQRRTEETDRTTIGLQ